MHQLLVEVIPDTQQQVLTERRRNIGIVLAEVGRQRLAGRTDIADLLDQLVTEIEHQRRRPR